LCLIFCSINAFYPRLIQKIVTNSPIQIKVLDRSHSRIDIDRSDLSVLDRLRLQYPIEVNLSDILLGAPILNLDCIISRILGIDKEIELVETPPGRIKLRIPPCLDVGLKIPPQFCPDIGEPVLFSILHK
jgi:hypothetical protein